MESNTDAAQMNIDEDSCRVIQKMKIDEDSCVIQKMQIDEDSWLIQISESLDALQEEDEENVKELCVSIFNVPKELMAEKPEAYIPQIVSIGPCHHWRTELHDMDHYKLSSACRFQKRTMGLAKFQSVIVEEFKNHDWHVRSCYHKFIEYKEETLAWIMALDAVFLLQCLQFFVTHADQSSESEVKQLARVLDLRGTSAVYNSVLRDLMMLENQMPLFLMKKLLELELGSEAKAEERLSSLLSLMFQELSPFSFKMPESRNLRINERRHMLEALYYCIVPLSDGQIPVGFDEEKDAPCPADMSTVTPVEEGNNSPNLEDSSTIRQAFSMLCQTLSSMNVGVARFLTMLLRRALKWKPSQFVMKLPFLLILTTFKRLDEDVMGNGDESSVKIIQPSPHELNIPSVADLHFAGVKFSPTDGDLTTIQFDEKTATLYLPRVKLDSSTEVILRNLVAFEASAAPAGALVLRRYTDFMNGMIDGVTDVKLLRESGIICNHHQSDGEVASLWNRMGKCVHPKDSGYLDKVIKDLNGYYSRNWKVVVVEFVNKHIFSSWKLLSLVAAAILLMTTCLQAYCSVYNCKKWVNQ